VSKPTKLLSFARTSGRGAVQPDTQAEEEAASLSPAGRNSICPAKNSTASTVEKKSRVATNLRLTRDQWRRVHELALDEETTVQQLAIRGLSRLFEERGLPRL
jgi:hypothetical protein